MDGGEGSRGDHGGLQDEHFVDGDDEASLAQVFFELLLLAVRNVPKGRPEQHTLRVSVRACDARVSECIRRVHRTSRGDEG